MASAAPEVLAEEVRAAPGEAAVRLGAEALASFAGVWRVAVFGSAARGTATPYSDIDYLVVCDEIDYEKRNKAALEMEDAAAAAAGFNVDIVLSDTAEWAARCSLASTFEAAVEAKAVNIVCRVQPIPKATERQTITMATESENAIAELQRMLQSLVQIRRSALPEPYETDAARGGEDGFVSELRAGRWMYTLQATEMAMEHGLSALGHATGSPRVRRDEYHQLAAFRDALADDRIRGLVAEILAPLRVAELAIDAPFEKKQLEFTKFRVVPDYGAATIRDEFVSGDRVVAYLRAVVAIGELALSETSKLGHPAHARHDGEQFLAEFEKHLGVASRFVDGYDPVTGGSAGGRRPR